jgi:hypothetical protein
VEIESFIYWNVNSILKFCLFKNQFQNPRPLFSTLVTKLPSKCFTWILNDYTCIAWPSLTVYVFSRFPFDIIKYQIILRNWIIDSQGSCRLKLKQLLSILSWTLAGNRYSTDQYQICFCIETKDFGTERPTLSPKSKMNFINKLDLI